MYDTDSIRALRIYLDLLEGLYTAKGLEVSCEFPKRWAPSSRNGVPIGRRGCLGNSRGLWGFTEIFYWVLRTAYLGHGVRKRMQKLLVDQFQLETHSVCAAGYSSFFNS